jgi:hypothetical protein
MKNILLASAALILAAAAIPAVAHDTNRYGNHNYNQGRDYRQDYRARVANRRLQREHARLHDDLNQEHAQDHAQGVNGADHADSHAALSETHDQFHRDHPAVRDNR